MSDLAGRIARLTDAQRAELLARARTAAGAGANGGPARIPPAPRDGDAVALSFTQWRLWFLEQFAPGLPLHNMSGVARIPVAMEPALVADCVEEVVRRHEILRTAFVVRDGQPVGVVAPRVRVPLRVLDAASEQERERCFLEDARAPFDLTAAPLLRLAVAPTGTGETFVQLTLHHLVSDGFSTGVLFGELGALYRARLLGERLELPPLPFAFADFAAWERERFEAGAGAAALEHWTRQLAGAPERLALPAARARPARMTYRGGRLAVELPQDVVAAVRRIGAERNVTPFAALLTAFAVVLSRYAGQEDLVVGVPVANREVAGAERAIGPFLNTIALRFRLDDAPTFAALLERVRRTALSGFEHQEVPFERVLQAVGAARDPSRSPLYQAMLNVQADRSEAARGPEIALRELPNGACELDLLLNLTVRRDGIGGHVDYYADVYDEEQVARVVESLATVLRAAAADPDRPVSELPLMPARRAAQLLERDGRAEPLPYDRTACLDELALAGARTHPERVALAGEDGTLTYGELDARVAALAARLRALAPAAPGAHVAICLPRSVDTVVALLAVLRAGFAYVPLDVEHPPERLAFVCRDAGAVALVTRGELLERSVVPALDVPALLLDEPLPAAPAPAQPPAEAEAEAEAAEPGRDPEACAYTMYTSGSTGRPKGVRVSHRNAVSLLEAMRVRPGLHAGDVLLAVTSPSFDISVLELLLPLVAGGTVVVAPPAAVADGRRLAALLDEHAVTVMQATPATWRLLLESGWSGRPGLRALCGGEAFPPRLAGELLARCAEVWNLYGPTETTIWSAVHRVGQADVAAGAIPLGRPIHNATAYVLDRRLEPVPPGVLGELCLGGDGVAIGYHERPELTAERFVEAPFRPGHRLYRTGDLVRRRPDGALEFAGRLDRQIKLRGFRIELGEIEAALEAHPGVGRAAAFVREDAAGEGTIVACVEAPAGAPEPPPSAEELRAQLRERLPDGMVPARIVALARLPLTPNGKLDRAALPSLARAAEADPEAGADGADGSRTAERRAERVAPRTDVERLLAALWQDLLELPEVGVHDGFFDLGGHSLLATKLVFHLRDVEGIELPLHVFFDGEPTIARLAATIEGRAVEDTAARARDMLDLDVEGRLPGDVRPAAGAHVHSVRHPQHLLVTGVTGFVGAFLLAELLQRTEARAFCLVRAPSAAEAHERIRAALTEHGVWEEAFAERIVPVVGSLARRRLGLARPEWQHLAAMVDGIYHCGAEVSFLAPYEALKATNVDGTLELLRLACEGAVKPFHLLSTTYVFSRFHYPPGAELTEDMDPIHALEYTFGYTQSKWVAERLALAAGRRGLPVYVYRAGRVAGHSETGVCQTYDFVWRATKVGIEMGAAPTIDMTLDITPVDYVVRALVHLSRQPQLRGQVFHLVCDEPIHEHDLVAWMEEYGYRGERLPFPDWCERVLQHAVELEDETAGALAPFLSGILPLERIPPARFDNRNVKRGLAGTSIVCPPIDDRLLRLYFDRLSASGYVPSPAQAAAAAGTAP